MFDRETELELKEQLSKGLYFAIRLVGKGTVIGGKSADDFVHDAFVSFFDGKRNCATKGQPTTLELCGAIRSLVYNTRRKQRHAKELLPEHDIMSTREHDAREMIEIWEEVRRLCARDFNAMLVLNHIEVDRTKPQEIARMLDLPVDLVHETLRRIRRRVRRVMTMQTEGRT